MIPVTFNREQTVPIYLLMSLKQLPYLLLSKIQPMLEKKVNDLLSIITDFTLKFDMSDSKIDIYIDRSIYKSEIKQYYSSNKNIKKINLNRSNIDLILKKKILTCIDLIIESNKSLKSLHI